MPGKSGDRGGGLLNGLSALVEKLGELAEKGEGFRRTGEIASRDKKVRGAYDVQVRVGAGEGEGEEGGARIEPVGQAPQAREQRTRARAGERVREPPVDLFEEESGLLIVAEMPGVECGDIILELRDDRLSIRAERDPFRYEKELRLPRPFSREQVEASCRNGVLELRLNDGVGEA